MASANPRILYVDNDKDNCELVGLMLHQANPDYVVTALTNPKDALELAENLPFDLYIFENWFPETSGAELCCRIRSKDSATPILFFSSLARDVERNAALAAGATEYLIKPRDLERLTTAVEYYMELENQVIAA